MTTLIVTENRISEGGSNSLITTDYGFPIFLSFVKLPKILIKISNYWHSTMSAREKKQVIEALDSLLLYLMYPGNNSKKYVTLINKHDKDQLM